MTWVEEREVKTKGKIVAAFVASGYDMAEAEKLFNIFLSACSKLDLYQIAGIEDGDLQTYDGYCQSDF